MNADDHATVNLTCSVMTKFCKKTLGEIALSEFIRVHPRLLELFGIRPGPSSAMRRTERWRNNPGNCWPHWPESPLAFRPASRRTAQAGRLCYPGSQT